VREIEKEGSVHRESEREVYIKREGGWCAGRVKV
jgi:hypothetical protein